MCYHRCSNNSNRLSLSLHRNNLSGAHRHLRPCKASSLGVCDLTSTHTAEAWVLEAALAAKRVHEGSLYIIDFTFRITGVVAYTIRIFNVSRQLSLHWRLSGLQHGRRGLLLC